MHFPLSIDTGPIAEAIGVAVDDLDHYLSAHGGTIGQDIADLLSEHLRGVDIKAANAATVDESAPARIDTGATPEGGTEAGVTGA